MLRLEPISNELKKKLQKNTKKKKNLETRAPWTPGKMNTRGGPYKETNQRHFQPSDFPTPHLRLRRIEDIHRIVSSAHVRPGFHAPEVEGYIFNIDFQSDFNMVVISF